MAICDTLKAFSDPVRQKIMVLLKDGKMTAGELAKELNITPAALSYHLKMLKKADLLMEYKEKNYIWYEINTTLFDELILWLKQFGGKSDEKNTVDGNLHSVDDNTVSG
ncbi:MAG: winged helix-turn-helix transcriptional regulator [Lachnospiraceae bacterium]|nr:winged helix-turn-helix transcriptional regulator [Lachnospiraceae bacterium]